MAILERIVTVYNDKGSKEALKDLRKLEESFANAGKTIAKAFGVAAAATAALAVKIGKDAVQGAIEDQRQQAALAVALRNTTNATDEQIASTVRYLDALELQVGVNNNELIPSLQKLTQATGDISQAQALQALALDVSAGTGKSLIQVTDAMVRALGGNIGALKKLGVPLDETIVKSKDLNKALGVLGSTFAGQAEKRAQTFEFQLARLRLQFDQTLDALGYALIPVLQDLAEMIRLEVLPAFDAFIAQNKDEIAEALRNFVEFAVGATRALAKMFGVIARNQGAFEAFAAILVGTFVGGKVAAGVQILISALTLLTGTFKKQAAAGTAAGVATAFATGGLSARAAAAGVLAFAAAAGIAFIKLRDLTSGFEQNGKVVQKQSQVVAEHLKDLERLAGMTAKATGTGAFDTKTTDEAINLEAARQNLLRENNIEEAARIALRQEEREQIKATIAEAQKYQDILLALSDTKITSEEIAVLAAKWGLSTEAVKNYLAQYFAVADQKITDEEIKLLAAAWGLTTEQAEKYLDFIKALKDSKLSPEEIKDLQDKWGMTVAEIEKYADFVLKVRDFKITDDEVNALGKAWGLTDAQVLSYLANIGVPFDYNGKFIDPVNGIGKAWKDTTGAVDAYIKSVGDADTALGVLATNATNNAATVTTALGNATAAAGALATAAEGALAIADAAQAAAEGAIATAQLASAQAEAARAAAEAAAAAIVEAEAAAAAARTASPSLPPLVSPGDFGSNTVTGSIASGDYESGIFGPNAGKGTTVNVTVNGSVISQDDLISTVRSGLLTGIGSGQVTTFDPREIP